jgi:bifunctional UDP-N-acetylglucosamine pyrophosphorylase/glucosamine-1-phosphate N-acetyltransferase
MWPLTSTRPKPLLPLPRGTLLSRLLRSLQGLVDGATVVVSREHRGLVSKYLEGYSWGFPVTVTVQEEARGTADAVRAGLEALPRSVDELLVIYGDLYYRLDLVGELVGTGKPSMVVVEAGDAHQFGIVVEKEGCLSKIVEKPDRAPARGYVNAGMYFLDRADVEDALSRTELSPRGEYEFTDTVTYIARRRCVRLLRARYEDWLDVGRPWDLLEAFRRELESLKAQQVEGEVEPGARLVGPVYVAPKAVVRSGSIVEGPAWIEGEVGPLAHLRPYSTVLEGARVGAFTQVKDSILLEGSRAPHLNYVGDSVVGEYANLGAGSVTANLRFDGETVKVVLKGRRVDTGRCKLGSMIGGYAQIGVNASLMPGVRVGAGAWVEPGITLYVDVPDCSFAKLRGGRIVVEKLSDRGAECRVEQTLTLRY